MRSLLYAVLCCASLLALTGCYDITEDVTITPSGSGVYLAKIDMSQLLTLFKTMESAQNNKDSSLAGENMDTTMSLKGYGDSLSGADPATKALIDAMTVHLVVHSDSNIFKMTMRAPFTNISQLQKLQEYMAKAGGLQSVVRLLGNKNDSSSEAPATGGTDRMGQVLQTQWSDHRITRSLNKALYDSLMNDPDMTQFRQLAAAMGAGQYNTVIHLPRPAQKVVSSSSHISGDKKTVTFEHTLTELFDAPDHFTFTIDY